MQTFDNDVYHFEYPDGAEIVQFTPERVRLIVPVGADEWTINMRRKHAADAHTALKELYENMPESWDTSFDVPPFQVADAHHLMWRARKRFVDGGRSPLVFDMVFVQVDGDLYDLVYSATPEVFAAGVSIFDDVIASFRVTAPTQN